jgi:hypothetical protein
MLWILAQKRLAVNRLTGIVLAKKFQQDFVEFLRWFIIL